MGKAETKIQNDSMLALSAAGHYVERIQSGLFLTKYGGRVRVGFDGRADTSGFRKEDARAFFIEFKTHDQKSKGTDDQIRFVSAMRARGALAGFARSVDEALAILDGWQSPLK